MRSFSGFGTFLLIVCAILALFVCFVPGASAAPATSCTLDIGAAQASPFALDLHNPSTATSLMGQLKLQVQGRDCGLSLGVRNAFYKSSEVYDKSCLTGEVTFPVSTGACIFLNYEDDYNTHKQWGWAGIRLNLFRL